MGTRFASTEEKARESCKFDMKCDWLSCLEVLALWALTGTSSSHEPEALEQKYGDIQH